MKRSSGNVWRLAAFALAGFVVLLSAGAGKPGADSDDETRVTSVRKVSDGIEIEVFRARGFPVRAQMTVLRIGEREFVRSRYPADGRHDTLIFKLSHAEFTELKDGLPVVVQYGRGRHTSPRARWDAGTLDKRVSDRGRLRRERRGQ